MAIYVNTIPYMVTQYRKVALPKNDPAGNRMGYNNLAFIFSENIDNSIRMMNAKDTVYRDTPYSYYYNQVYRGVIGARRYNIKEITNRKSIYEKVTKQAKLHVVSTTMLNKVPNRNCYFDMCKYIEIYNFMTGKMHVSRKVNIFWSYFKSIWFSEQTSTFANKFVLIDADMFPNMSGTLKEAINNPLFLIYYTLYKKFDLVSELDIDFIIYSHKAVLRINPSKCDEKSYAKFKRELQKVFNKTEAINMISDSELDESDATETVKAVLKKKYNFTGDGDKSEVTELKEKETKNDKTSEMSKKIEDAIDKKVEKVTKKASTLLPDSNDEAIEDYIKTKSEIDLSADDELIKDMYNMIKQQKVPTTPLSTARDRELRARQEKITLGKMTLEKINERNSSKTIIPTKDISKSIKNINPNVKYVKFNNLNKEYIEKVMPQDIVKTFTCLNDKEFKFFIRDIKITDSSDELNYVETWHVTLDDEKKGRHTITFDVPKFLDNKFMYLGGNKKIINRQNFLYPVVKTAPDTVQIVTNYNKMFIRRIGTKSISSVERIIKLIAGNEECAKLFTVGNGYANNRSALTTIEYDEFSKNFTKFQTAQCTIYFNQVEATEYADTHSIEIPEHCTFIGLLDKKPIYLESESQLVVTPDELKKLTDENEDEIELDGVHVGQSLSDLIVSELPEDAKIEFNKTRSTKRLMYTTATVMSQSIPFIVLLTFWEGFSKVIAKMKLKHRFSKTYPNDVKPTESVIRFKDAYFIYEGNLATNLLMNGMKALDTANYEMTEYDTKEPYMDYIRKVYGKVTVSNALVNYAEFMLDPITLEILEDINLPTDLVELCIYANSLLADETYTMENSQTLSRVRSVEIIPAMLYNTLSREYLNYKNTAGKGKLSVPRDCIIKQLLALQTVEDYSTLNPVVELEKDRAITSKGFRGINVDRAYSEEKRSYDPSMIGVIAMSTSPDGNCGVNRFMSLEPNVTTTRGYVDIKENRRDELKDVNVFSPAELLYPLGNTRDDSIRIAMACKQSKHVIPVKNSTPALISNGSDESVMYNLSSDFVVVAEEDGKIIDYDKKSQIMMIEYKSGKHKAVNLAPTIVKNGGGGFFLSNVLTTKFKVGDTFKKDAIIAYHKDFFKDDKFNGVRMNVGVLEKIAISSSYDTYNDSTMITEKLARDAESAMTFCKSVVLGKNSNIYDIRKVGDHVSIGDPLVSFDTSFDDSDLNKLLANLSEENKQVLEESATNTIKSKYAGEIIDIKIYSTVELEELSDSLRAIVSEYYSRINHKKKFVSQYDKENKSIVKCGLLLNESSGKVEPNIYGVIKGQKVENSVLIEFYIEHGDIMGVGDKLAFFTALKGIVCEVIPEGYEPWSEFRPDEEVSSLLSASSILKRQTPSILLTMLGNKVIVELKRKLQEIYDS